MIRKRNIPHSPLLKKRRKQVVILKALGALFIVALLCSALIWGANHEKLLISNITISGAEVTNPELVEDAVLEILSGDYFYFFPKANSLIYPREEIVEKLLEEFTRFSDVSIHFVNFKTIRVDVVERIPYGLWCGEASSEVSERECYFLDDAGYIFDKSPRFFGSVYFLSFGPLNRFESVAATSPIRGTLLAEGVFEKIVLLRDKLSDEKIETTYLVVHEHGDIDIYMETGGRLILSGVQDFDNAFADFLIALDTKRLTKGFDIEQIEYVDLRFNEKVYFKFNEE